MKRIVFALAILITSWSFASLTDGLVGYWPFDGDAKDYSGNGNHGVTHGVSFTDGWNGSSSAAHFDGNDYVSVPASGKISQIFDFSVTAWMKINRYETASNGTKWCSFVSKGGDSIRQFGVQFGVDANGAAFFVQFVGKGDKIPCPKIPINTWTHIAVTRSGLNVSLYINGVGVAMGTNKSYPEQHSGDLEIGRDSPGEVEYFHGEMSDVCLFNRKLSAAEVSAIYNGGLKIRKVVFKANAVEVEGAMPSLSVLSGTQEKLPKNAFRRHDGYVFQGWAKSKSDADNGIVKYQDEEEITIESDMTLYAVWAPSLTLAAESADWSSGSITLKATGISLKEGEDFFLSYCDASAAESAGAQWDYVEDYVSTSDGTGVSFTDTQFSSRLGGIPAVRYRLQIGKSKDDVRATMCCTTRTRFGLSIGLGSYDSKVYKLYAPKDLSICRNNAELANDVMVQKGGGILPANMVLLTDRTANKATVENISQEWEELAQKAKPGDVIFSFIATHGHASGAVLAYDDLYTIGKFQRDIEPFRTGSQIGVKVVILLLNCHSEAMTSAEHDINFEYGSLCTPNIIYVAVADAKESEVSLHRDDDSSFYAKTYSAGGEFFINQGMNKHRADNLKTLHGVEGVFGNRDGRVDLLECTEYMKALAIGKSDQNPTHVQYDSLKSDIMKDTIMVSSDTFSDVSVPQAPRITDVSEKFFSTTIKVQWEEVSNAQYYKVFYAKAGESTEHWIACNGGLTELEIKTADIATADDREDYTPLDNDTFYEFSMVAVNAGGHSLRSNVYTKKTSIASQSTVYKVSLYANGGSVSPTFKNVENGHIVGSLPTPTRNGRTFLGWFTDAVDGVEIGEHSIVSKDIKCYAHWSKPSTVINLPTEWLRCYPSFAMQASDNPLEASELISANGCRTVGECYALGIDPEDPNDDLRITDFKMENGKPVIKLNHTEDGSGESFRSRIKILGKTNLKDAAEEWREVPEDGDASMRFFKVEVEMPQ